MPPCANQSLICNRPKYCVGAEDLRIVDPVDGCTGYYYCVFGEFTRDACPQTTVFDTEDSFCQCRFANPDDVCQFECTPPSTEPDGPEGKIIIDFECTKVIFEK